MTMPLDNHPPCEETIAQVCKIKGIPRLLINHKSVVPVCYLPSATEFTAEQDAQEMKLAAEHGVRLLVIPWAVYDYADREAFVKRLKEDVLHNSSMSLNPDAYLILRIGCMFSTDQLGVSDQEAQVLNGTERSSVCSMASDAWYEKVCEIFKQVVSYVAGDPLLNHRVIGYEFLGGDSGEWFGPDYWDGKMDTSEPNRRKFAEYLKKKYCSKEALRESWADDTADFDDACIPHWSRLPGISNADAHKENVRSGQTLIDQPQNRRYVDYLDYANLLRADRLAGFARTIKKYCNNNKITITYYGYHADCYTASSNHFGMSHLLRCKEIDVLSSPVSYQDRCDGGIGAYMGMVDAVTAAGKLWMEEGDYRSPVHTVEPPLPYPATTQLLDQVIRREIGKCMIYSTGVWWLSFNQGWFNYPSFWENNEQLMQLMAEYEKVKKPSTGDVCLILDEHAMSLAGDADATGLQLLRFARSVLYRSGFRFEMHLLEDVLEGRVDDASMYLFINPWRLNHDQAVRIADKVHRPGKVSVYMYGYGMTDPMDFELLTGMPTHSVRGDNGYTPSFRLASSMDSALADSTYQANLRLGITQALVDLALTEINPVYYVDDEAGITPCGVYSGGPADKKTGLAVYTKAGWHSVFCGNMKISDSLLRFSAQVGDIHAYCASGDVFHADDHFAMLHVTEPGDKIIQFPQKCDIYCSGGQWTTGDSIRIPDTYRGETIFVLYGRRSELYEISKLIPDREKSLEDKA